LPLLRKVSIVLPTYNRKDLVGKSIQSVLDQTYADFELIIVDDASTDGTEEVIKSFSDPRMVYLKHETNQGGAAARNTGIRAAKGEFIAFQDSDDIWLKEKLAKQIVVFEKSTENVGLVYSLCARNEGNKERIIPDKDQIKTEGNLYKELLLENFITLPSAVIRKSCFEKVGLFDQTLPRFQDWELFIRLSKHFEFRYVPEPLVTSYFTEGSISSKPEAMIKALEIILHNHLEDYKSDSNLYARKLIGLANLYRIQKDLKTSRSYLVKGYKTNRRPGLILPIFASFFGIGIYDCYWEWMQKIHDKR